MEDDLISGRKLRVIEEALYQGSVKGGAGLSMARIPSLLQSRLPEGYTLRVDEKDCLLWLEYPDKSISKSISVDDLQAIVQKVMDYMRYELDKLRKD